MNVSVWINLSLQTDFKLDYLLIAHYFQQDASFLTSDQFPELIRIYCLATIHGLDQVTIQQARSGSWGVRLEAGNCHSPIGFAHTVGGEFLTGQIT